MSAYKMLVATTPRRSARLAAQDQRRPEPMGPSIVEWHFLEANHGKGAYDAEGGIIKYYVRRYIKKGGVLLTAKATHDFLVQELGGQVAPSEVPDQDKPYIIDNRVFFYIGPAEEAVFDCTGKPDWSTHPAAAEGAPYALRVRAGTRGPRFGPHCLKFEALGNVVEHVLPSLHGTVAVLAGGGSEPTPYTATTLNIPGKFKCGSWRRLSCCCRACLYPYDCVDSQCTSHGLGRIPPQWWSFVAGAKPSDPWLQKWVDIQFPTHMPDRASPGMMENAFKLIRDQLISMGRFKAHSPACVSFVSRRFTGTTWVTTWLRPVLHLAANQRNQFQHIYVSILNNLYCWTHPAGQDVASFVSSI